MDGSLKAYNERKQVVMSATKKWQYRIGFSIKKLSEKCIKKRAGEMQINRKIINSTHL